VAKESADITHSVVADSQNTVGCWEATRAHEITSKAMKINITFTHYSAQIHTI
jgi:hypothetical protein